MPVFGSHEHPPEGWNLYFPGEDLEGALERRPFIEDVAELGFTLLESSGAFEDTNTFLDSAKAVEIDYETLQSVLDSEGHGLLLKEEPVSVIKALGLAAYKVSSFVVLLAFS
jgi:hypothetical protein